MADTATNQHSPSCYTPRHPRSTRPPTNPLSKGHPETCAGVRIATSPRRVSIPIVLRKWRCCHVSPRSRFRPSPEDDCHPLLPSPQLLHDRHAPHSPESSRPAGRGRDSRAGRGNGGSPAAYQGPQLASTRIPTRDGCHGSGYPLPAFLPLRCRVRPPLLPTLNTHPLLPKP